MTTETPASFPSTADLFSLYLVILLMSPVVVRQFWGLQAAKRWLFWEFAMVPVVAVLVYFVTGAFQTPPGPDSSGGFLRLIFDVIGIGVLALTMIVMPWIVVLLGAGLMSLLPAFETAWRSISRRFRD